MSAVQKEVQAKELVQQLKLLRRIVSWCVVGFLTGFMTLAVCIVEPVLKTTFDRTVGVVSVCMTGLLFVSSAIACWSGLLKLKRGLR